MKKITYKYFFLNHKSPIARFFAAYGWISIIITTVVALDIGGDYDAGPGVLLTPLFLFLISYIVEIILSKISLLKNKFIKKYILLNNTKTNSQIYALFGWVFAVAGLLLLFTGKADAALPIMGFSVCTFIYSIFNENMSR